MCVGIILIILIILLFLCVGIVLSCCAFTVILTAVGIAVIFLVDGIVFIFTFIVGITGRRIIFSRRQLTSGRICPLILCFVFCSGIVILILLFPTGLRIILFFRRLSGFFFHNFFFFHLILAVSQLLLRIVADRLAKGNNILLA